VKLWEAVADEFDRLDLIVEGRTMRASGAPSGSHINVRIGHGAIHYEWIWRRSFSAVDVALHFETDDIHINLKWLDSIKASTEAIRKDVDLDFSAAPWGKKWAEVRFRVPFDTQTPVSEVAPKAAAIMKLLIERTYPILKSEIL